LFSHILYIYRNTFYNPKKLAKKLSASSKKFTEITKKVYVKLDGLMAFHIIGKACTSGLKKAA